MNFLEAKKILAGFQGGAPLHIRLAASGTVDPLVLYVRAIAATQGKAASVTTIPFGTLGQALLSPPPSDAEEVVLLLPWDLVPEADWRSGIPADSLDRARLLQQAHGIAGRLSVPRRHVVYLPAPLPPLFLDPDANSALENELLAIAAATGARVLDRAAFGLGNYLASGTPVAGARSNEVAAAVVSAASEPVEGIAKVLITDLDNVMWHGLAAEDGASGVLCGPEGKGFRHFLYQSLLLKLKQAGVLIAAVSRNDLDVARGPIAAGTTALTEADFVEILASYDAKSSHIKQLAASLNLGLDSFVFVDDNPIELAEVAMALPMVTCVQFPEHDDGLSSFLHRLTGLFARRVISAEDRERTELYRRRLAAAVPQTALDTGADLTQFLQELRMELRIYDRSTGERERAVQLINKTNQFNLNGKRIAEEDVERVLAAGGRLYTAKLDDRTGSHGEILALLIDSDQRAVSFVMSCRVFQRRVEHAFVGWLVERVGDVTLDLVPTERNTPIREFLGDVAASSDGKVRIDRERFLAEHGSARSLFTIIADGTR